MKKVITISTLFFIIAVIICCQSTKNELLTNEEWNDVLGLLGTSKQNKASLFTKFENIEMENILEEVYIANKESLCYKINDSIIQLLQNRKNTNFNKNKKVGFNLTYIDDTLNCKEYNVLSEPFFIKDSLICLSIRFVNTEKNSSSSIIYFFEKNNNGLQVIEFYNIDKDRFYSRIPKF